MSGFIITLRKNPFRYFEKNRNVLLGHYDRLEVRETFAFPDFYFSMPVKEDNEAQDCGFINPTSYGETQQIYLFRLPKRDDFENSSEESIKAEENNESLDVFFKLMHESGKNCSVKYDITAKRDCCKCNKKDFSPRYFVVSLLALSEFADSYFSLLKPRRHLFEKLKSHIIEHLLMDKSENSPHIDFEILSSMGSGDVGILWYTQDITLPAKCLERLKRTFFRSDKTSSDDIPLIFSTYSVISLISDKYCADPMISEDENVFADIHLSYKSGADQGVVLCQLCKKCKTSECNTDKCLKKKAMSRYGNYDTTVRIHANKIPLSLYSLLEDVSGEEEFCLDIRSKVFRENCLQEYTRFIFSDTIETDNKRIYLEYEQDGNLKEYFNNKAIERFEKQKYDEDKRPKLKELSELTQKLIGLNLIKDEKKKYEIFLRSPHLQESIAQTFQGLTRVVISAHNNKWSEDLYEQYEAVLCAIKHMLEQDEKRKHGNNRETYEQIVRLLKVLKQTYAHIEQGNRTYFDAPGSGLSYAGSHERAIWAYYGIVKLFIEIIYRIKRKSAQVKLIPILEFSDTPLIESTPYPYETNNEEHRLIVCTLPYGALYNMPKYIRFLAHELHHYCTPPDRYIRNRTLGVYTIALMLSNYMFYTIASSESSRPQTPEEWEETDLGKLVGIRCVDIALPLVYYYYDDILKDCAFIADKEQIRFAPWEVYSKRLASLFNVKNWNEIKYLYDDKRPDITGIFKLFCDKLKELFEKIDDLRNSFETHKKEIKTENVVPNTDSKIARKFVEELEKELKKEKDTERVIRKFSESKSNVEELVKKFQEKEENSDNINAVLANAYGVMEASCDHFMQQITKLEFLPGEDIERIEKDEKFFYLNIVADYLYACGTNIDKLNDNGGELCIRLGIHLQQLFLKDKQFLTAKEEIDELSERLGEWKADNEIIRKEREREGRNAKRVEFREKCCELFNNMYLQFADKRGFYFVEPNLLNLSDFEYVFEWMFEKQGNKQNDDDNKIIFQQRAKRFRKFSKKYYKIQDSNNSKKIRSIICFYLHAEIIEFFNRQPSLRDLNEIHKETHNKTELKLSKDAENRFVLASYGKFFSPIWDYEVYSYNDFFKRYEELSNRLIGNGEKYIWYRGNENSEFQLAPTLYRDILKIQEKSGSVFSERISDFQRMYLEQFMARVPESSEIRSVNMMGAIDWIACMQHYSAPTNLLDWSENLLTALYFMLEPLILSRSESNKPHSDKNREYEKRKSNALKNGVSLYLFDPIAYNTMWLKKRNTECDHIRDIYLSERMPLPNLSMAYNADQFTAYVLGNTKNETCERNKNMCTDCAIDNPIAVLTGQSNARLKTQAGTFLAFSLHRMTTELKKASLELLQEKWLKPDDTKEPFLKEPFLYKITLKAEEELEKLTEWTIRAGMSTYRVYPEMQNISSLFRNTI